MLSKPCYMPFKFVLRRTRPGRAVRQIPQIRHTEAKSAICPALQPSFLRWSAQSDRYQKTLLRNISAALLHACF